MLTLKQINDAQDFQSAMVEARASRQHKTPLRFTNSELDLIWTECNAAIENGAEDVAFLTIRTKISAERARRANRA